ncbi:D-alanyl-D-alanine carboxypeptidase/D-alanyl-D-alanine-endopeptidase [Chroococcidiopsis sp. FACHB-1243]|uniref:D-alanyl-D-alanine carboxypeptidase/D-alanyl-D-alanine endopeptidase n=1 Tax=Chroococcidiopsis sp. [FACHB-1243] TaxID=2692781 RepID=UPI00177F9864|nr:D-alanyl-D-alanine carboxypeptidase/D-alanyl-D-alanine-endopeptidase [Chroococcidiopsis sp. [FACHB-1243]]MBD2308286.1 D-alanyl-D-alanine carboxypeptidase/D-alanyl-D-alanine-endopeptidase [Chroococcidiopsis sp. [FACHB-1243]]
MMKSALRDIVKPVSLLLTIANAQIYLMLPAIANNIPHASLPHASLNASLKIVQQPLHNATNAICPAQLETAIATAIDRSQLNRARWGILVQTVNRGDLLYSRDAQNYFIPASNVKLFTTAAALQRLGSQFQIRTSVYPTIAGGLRVIGRGDPSLTDIQLQALATQVKQQQFHRISQLVAEDDYFQGSVINPGWQWEDIQSDYGAPVNSLILNQNTVKLTAIPQQVGQPLRLNWSDLREGMQWQIENEALAVPAAKSSLNVRRDSGVAVLKVTGQMGINAPPESINLAVVDPKAHFLRHFQRSLAQAGITLSPGNELVQQQERQSTLGLREIAFVVSPPLSELLVETNQQSNNLYAEALLRILGAKLQLTPTTQSTDEIGLQNVKETLTALGVDPTGYVLADGSGLSRQNLASPIGIVQTLRVMANSPLASVYRTSLPVAGVSGTLKSRFQGTTAQGIVLAKTGTMSGVVALSGYINPPKYEPLVFSIIVNQSDQPASVLRQTVDDLVLFLTRLQRC